MGKAYMVVSNDEYELPLFVSRNIEEIAKFVNKSSASVYSQITRGNIDKKLNAKYVRVKTSDAK